MSQVDAQCKTLAYGFAHLPAALSSVSLLLQPVLAAIYALALAVA